MGKRKNKEKDEEYIRKKIKKLENKLQMKGSPIQDENEPPPIVDLEESENEVDITDDQVPEDLLLALGNEGEEIKEDGAPIQKELALRWTKIIYDGVGKEARDKLIKKYPTPSNFPASISPIMNPEIAASLSEQTFKRDKRIIYRQNLVGKLMNCLGKSLTSVLKGNLNSKNLVEEISDAAKIAAEIFHQDSSSRKFFALAGASKTIQNAVKNEKADAFLFGKDCNEKIKAAQALQKTGAQIKAIVQKPPSQKPKNLGNWKSPSQPQLSQYQPPQYRQHRARGGRQPFHRQPLDHTPRRAQRQAPPQGPTKTKYYHH